MNHRIAFVTGCFMALLYSRGQAQTVQWSVDTKPVVTLGATGDGSTTEFAFVTGATRLPDGNFMVSDRGDYSMFIVSPGGQVVKKFGRMGSGPGELKNPFFSWTCGKQVFVGNNGNASMSVFALDGTYIRSYRVGTGIGKSGPYRTACNREGWFVHYGWDNSKGQKAGVPFRSQVPVWLAAGDSSSGKLITTVLGSERVDNSPRPLGRESRIAIGTSRVYVGEAETYSIKVFGLDGKSFPTLVKAATPVAVTTQDINDDMDRLVAIMGAQYRAAVEKKYSTMPLPKTLPPYRELLVDSDQNLWVRDYARRGDNVVWTVFDNQGKLRAEVTLPNALEVYEIGRDYVLGRYIDPDGGEPEVRQYALKRR